MRFNKKGEIWNKLVFWILALILLIVLLLIIYDQKGTVANLLEDLKTIFRFGGR